MAGCEDVVVSSRPPAARGSIPAPPPLDAGAAAHAVDVAAYFSDPDGDPLTYQARSSKERVATVRTTGSTVSVTPRAKGTATITVTGSIVSVTPRAGGIATITVIAADPDGLTASQQFQVTVRNRPPAAQGSIPEPPTLDVGASAHVVDVAAYFADPDGDPLTYQADSWGELVATVRTAESTVSVTPRAQGNTTITVTAADSGGLTASQQFQVTVRAPRPPPVPTPNRTPAAQGFIPATPPLKVGASAHEVEVAAYFTDPDGDALTYQADSSDELVATVRTAGSTVSITPRAKGTTTITVTAADSGGLTASQQFQVTVRAPRPPPVPTPNRAPAAQGFIPATPPLEVGASAHEVDVAAYFTDPDGDALTYQADSSDESVATVRTAGSTVSVTPRARGTATITVTATDPGNLTATQQVHVTVRNRPPSTQGSIPEPPPLDVGASAHQVDVAAYFSDPDGDTLTYQARSSQETVATVRTAESTVSITPRAKGNATITVTATDPGNLTATQQVHVTVRNRPPSTQGSIPEPPPLDVGASAHQVDVAAYFSDPDGDTLTYQARSSQETVATVRTAESTVSVTPRAQGNTTITVTATDQGDLSATQQFAVTVRPPAPLKLLSLTVTGGSGSMYPAFADGVHHYAVRCGSSTTLRVRAQASRAAARVTLLRADASANQAATGSLDASVAVNGDHDVVIELSDGGAAIRYVVHCIPTDFPNIRILKKTAGASDGLLFISFAENKYHAVVDYNGVPRHHFEGAGWSFRPHANGPYVNGRQIRYSRTGNGAVYLMDAEFNLVHTERYPDLDRHGFALGPNSYFFVRYVWSFRDMSVLGGSAHTLVQDSVITEVPYDGSAPVHWNSWYHLKIADCNYHRRWTDYAHLNSLQIVDGDLIASFHSCGQIVRIDWPSGSVEWQLGGSNPPRAAATEYLEIVGDPLAGFCGQHQATLTGTRILLFDNGTFCGLADGPGGHPRNLRRNPVHSRAVEYDMSSGTGAAFVREYRRPAGHSYSLSAGGVTLLDNGNWLIAWGQTSTLGARTVAREAVAVVTEVDTSGAAVFHMNITTRGGSIMRLYRVYYADTADVAVPRSLP